MNNGIAVYPGTFDPFTRGHEDLVRRAARLFAHVIVGIAESRGKRPVFDLAERVEIAAELLSDLPNVRVIGFDGLLMQFLRERNANVIVRGLRAVSDFEYEFQMVGMNQKLNPDIETVFLMADPTCQAIASRLVKEIARLKGEVSQFVPADVERRLKAKYGLE